MTSRLLVWAQKIGNAAERIRRWRLDGARSQWLLSFAPHDPRRAEAVRALHAAHAELTRIADRYGTTSPQYQAAQEAVRAARRATPWWWRV
jgi:hypothetical protein